MHGTCVDYNIQPETYLNKCQGGAETIPVTVMLVSMYNACFTYQKQAALQLKLLLLALGWLDLKGALPSNTLITMLKKSNKYGNFAKYENFHQYTVLTDSRQNLTQSCTIQTVCHGMSVTLPK
jgi:hypothetical protein